MTSRILPPAEYQRLIGTDAEVALPFLTDAARVVVVERDGAIVGCHVLQPILHAECLWIREDCRKHASVGRRLWRAVQHAVREEFGVRWFFTGCGSDEVRVLLEKVGARELPAHFMVPVGGR